jgi:Mn-dependent DtxR family transcriptional regulator
MVSAFTIMDKILSMLKKMEKIGVEDISKALGISEPIVKEVLQAMAGIELVEVNSNVKLTELGRAIAEIDVNKNCY